MRPRRARAGFSLLEVLIATSVLLGAVIVLSELASIGLRNAVDAEESATAQLLCQAKLNEILAGIVPAQDTDEAPFDERPEWRFTVEIEPLDRLDLLSLTVRVWHDEGEEREPNRSGQFTLVRWMSDSQISSLQPGDSQPSAGSIPSGASLPTGRSDGTPSFFSPSGSVGGPR